MTSRAFDVAIIGAGHNGLVAAAYLARARQRVVVLEAREVLGGGVAEQVLAPGYRAPACAHLIEGFDRRVVADLELERHGLDLSRAPLATLALAPGAAPLRIDAEGARRLAAHGEPEAVDGEGLERLRTVLDGLVSPLAVWLDRAPPRLATFAPGDLRAIARLGLDLRGLGAPRLRELLRIAGMNVADLLDEHLDDAHLAGVLAFDAVAGTRLGPRSPGTVLPWLYRLALRVRQRRAGGSVLAGPVLPVGGTGRLVEALASAARSVGAQVRSDAAVTRILTDGDAVWGVEIGGAEVLEARCVLSTLPPGRTLLDLVGAERLDVGLVRALGSLRSRGAAAKLDLALDALPMAPGVDAAALGARLVISPGVDALERAFNHVKYGEHSTAPALEVVLPSVHDPALAPHGCHLLSALVLYASDRASSAPGGADAARDALRDAAIGQLETVMPGVGRHIVAAVLRTPPELEEAVGLGAGHWHHLEIGFDQFFWSRPLPELARGATPIDGLFLGGAGTHPGGGVSGLPGANAARAILSAGRGR